ncbi:hydroxymethylglutaryl-CoA reductase, degradative [Candidatus Poseidoniaceae archaeon]|nr:hydroxymethylglutaryl-CoA reductase, degradative [Euryarchaeota archaeon]MDA8610076.1 hydroxymethylglutaryl-CoA reductase, degradative [Euryarchaeota archaeon]MDA9156295.1 hydroxymethylglutaryl-CoA reductase, degradative [Candidatus Poseidoniaceae archaeon]MDA9167082.1 hydroxymethylglutaryl-CoA reductase, degradative [Candidatus Poseidoniaceae archaeon]
MERTGRDLMAVENSRLSGFFRHSVAERRAIVAEMANLTQEQVDALEACGALSEDSADRMIENVIGTMSLPVGIATNFVIDGKHYLIPFCLEESSVVAAASNMAKRCLKNGGFSTNSDAPMMIAQLQVLDCQDWKKAEQDILEAADELMALCNSLPSTMIRLGGGCKRIETRLLDTISGPMLIVHIIVDCRDAMGANAVNTMAELIAPRIEQITGGRVHLRILSNLAAHRLARVQAVFTPEEISEDGTHENGVSVIEGILEAQHFAMADPFRAATHNKGVMNAISSVGVACGQDWRAIEAGCHAWAAYSNGTYGSMTSWEKDSNGNLVGTIETPMAVGIVGGASKVHPVAQANLAILGVESAQELAGIIASAGLSQNLGALRALSTKGIQAGHMKLHARNMAVSAGAVGDEIEIVAARLQEATGPKTQTLVGELLEALRNE